MPRTSPPKRQQEDAAAAPAPAASLGEQAYIAIKRMILTQELRAGDQINVAQLSEQLSLGRSPIHLAIHRLDREGLVDILPRKGILVKAETIDSFLELIAARLLVEPHLTGLAVDNATPALLERLRAVVAAGWECNQRQDRLGSMEIDRQFHQLLYAAAGNDILAEFAGSLLDRSMRLWFRPPAGKADKPNVAELEDLYNMVERGDKKAAVRRMEQHIGSVRGKFLSRE
ncbi:GntR family transcriptional regulator [Achromobacter veterisilvae]|uniref:GntR family transcriptional regulator n=1 Tax=Achromobacter veterisilvae TaxID=2069367 RepID=A0ABZ2S3J4_9BURK|nr:GntR family transcriptional regulator [Achromobacter sp.]MCW0207958.1 GntR family transcriptional regulator [Achromobacter sp.]